MDECRTMGDGVERIALLMNVRSAPFLMGS